MKNTTKPLALIVGGSSGIGFATAKQLLERGIDTVIIGSSLTKLETAMNNLSATGNIETLQADLYEANDVQRVVDFAADHSRHIKYFVNAAGKFKPTPFLEYEDKDYDTYLDLNRAAFFIAQAVAKNMQKNGGGSIVHIGSMWAKQAIKATPSSALFNGKGRIACSYATHGDGIG